MRLIALLLVLLPSLALAVDTPPGDSAMRAKPPKPHYQYVVPNLTVEDSVAAIAFYEKAFGAQQRLRYPSPDGKHTMYAELQIGDCVVALGDSDKEHGAPSPKDLGGTAVTLTLMVEDVDTVYKSAIAAGAKPIQVPTDMNWGGRFASLSDPFGHRWAFVGPPTDAAKPEAKDTGPAKPDNK